MADPEKLTALKKVYADTILNTAKEAAVRVMVSERKASGYEQELFSVRAEAQRMLMRLKLMFDSKVKEADMSSLSKQNKIEELEAQLGEAEDIVEELRIELRELQDELEKVTNNQMQPPDDQIPNEETVQVPVSLLKDHNSLNTSEAVKSSPPVAHGRLVIPYDMNNSILDGTYNMVPCSYKGNGYNCSFEFPSVVRSCQEPELYQNGCTQRIHALERSVDNGNLSVSGKVHVVNDEPFVREEEEECSDTRVGANPAEVKVCAVESSSRKRKRSSRYKKRPKSPSCGVLSESDTCQVSVHSDVSNSPSSVNGNVNAGEEDSPVTKNHSENNPDSLCAIDLRKEDNGTTENSKTDLEAVRSNGEASGFSEETPVSPGDKRCIKYTFKRKRKKESLSSPDRDSLVDGEKENGCLEAPKSGLITESSRDSCRLASTGLSSGL